MRRKLSGAHSLPGKPNASFYRKQAKALYRAVKEQKTWALERFKKSFPRNKQTDFSSMRLASAQSVIAREHGFSNWQFFIHSIYQENHLHKKQYSKQLRVEYADAICNWSKISSKAIREAFVSTPREDFEGDAPWTLLSDYWAPNFYREVSIKNIYKNVHIASKKSNSVNNATPSTQASWINAVDPQRGEKVLHIGCGSGYYTAILCELVGKSGEVFFYDQDRELTKLACGNLRNIDQAKFSNNPESLLRAHTLDVIYINAGSPCIHQHWLDALNDGGRLLVSLTSAYWGFSMPHGETILINRMGNQYKAGFFSMKSHSLGGFSQDYGPRNKVFNDQLKASYKDKSYRAVKSLRIDNHEQTNTCWIHLNDICLSKEQLIVI